MTNLDLQEIAIAPGMVSVYGGSSSSTPPPPLGSCLNRKATVTFHNYSVTEATAIAMCARAGMTYLHQSVNPTTNTESISTRVEHFSRYDLARLNWHVEDSLRYKFFVNLAPHTLIRIKTGQESLECIIVGVNRRLESFTVQLGYGKTREGVSPEDLYHVNYSCFVPGQELISRATSRPVKVLARMPVNESCSEFEYFCTAMPDGALDETAAP